MRPFPGDCGATGHELLWAGRLGRALDDGDVRLASHLADFAGWAAPDDPEVHAERADIYLRRRKLESSLMSKGIFAAAARESQVIVDGHAST